MPTDTKVMTQMPSGIVSKEQIFPQDGPENSMYGERTPGGILSKDKSNKRDNSPGDADEKRSVQFKNINEQSKGTVNQLTNDETFDEMAGSLFFGRTQVPEYDKSGKACIKNYNLKTLYSGRMQPFFK